MISNSDQLRIVAFLKRFGCNRSESLTYIEVLTSGTTSIQELARKLKQNRVSVYYSVAQLVGKGFLFEIRKGKKRFIAAESPDVLLRIIGQRYKELEALEIDVGYISKLLNAIPVIKQEVTVVKLYEEIDGFKKMLEESLQAKGEIITFSNTPIFVELLGEEYYDNYFAKKAAKRIRSRIIYSPGDSASKLNMKKDQYKIDLKIFPEHEGSEAGFYLWDNTLVVKSFKENKISCTLIENKDIANFFRENIFNHFWKESKSIDECG